MSGGLSGTRVYSINHEHFLFDHLPASVDNTDYWDQEVCTNQQFEKAIEDIKKLEIKIKNIYHLYEIIGKDNFSFKNEGKENPNGDTAKEEKKTEKPEEKKTTKDEKQNKSKGRKVIQCMNKKKKQTYGQ